MPVKKKLFVCLATLTVISCFVMGFMLYCILQAASLDYFLLRLIITGFSIVFVLVVIFVGIMMYLLFNGILKPLNKLCDAVHNMKNGDLDVFFEYNNNDEFGKVYKEFDELRQELKSSAEKQLTHEKNKKEMIVNIAHDIKTPVTSISGHIQGIMDGIADTPEKQKRYLNIILEKTNVVDKLVNDLFLYSKFDMAEYNYKKEKINIVSFLSDICSSTELENDNLNIKFTYDIDANTIVFIDIFNFKRVIQNIVDNSIKYNNLDDVNIFVSATSNKMNNDVIIKLQDNGVGISEEDTEKIFEQFFRSDTSRTSKGSGLGLSISKQIINGAGGKIWARSKPGCGLSIYISLPYINPNFNGGEK